MQVNFDGLRRNGIRAYNALAKELNRHVHGERIGDGVDFGDPLVVGDIRDQMDDLRSFIATIGLLEGDQTDAKALDFTLIEFAPEAP